jgi:hypothetical protein
MVPELSIALRPEDGPMQWRVLRSLAVQRGVNDLGDVVLAPAPLVLRGRIERDGAPFAGPCELVVERERTRAGEPPTWRVAGDGHAVIAADGQFAVYGPITTGRHRLTVRCPVATLVAPVDFVPGAVDVVVALATTHRLAARALLPADAPPPVHSPFTPATAEHWLTARLLAMDAARVDGGDGANTLVAAWWPDPDGRVDLHWSHVRPGRYTLEVRLGSHASPLARIPDVLVPPPPGGDPRLAGIDLRALVAAVTVTLCDASGSPLAKPEGVALVGPPPARGPWCGESIESSTLRVLAPVGTYELLLCVEGFRPHAVRGPATAVVARLEPWPVCALRFPEAPPLPDGMGMRVELVAPDAPATARTWLTGVAEGPLAKLLQPTLGGVPVRDGEARLSVGDGPHALHVTLVSLRSEPGRPRMVALAGVEPGTILPTMDEVEVRVPAAAWQAAIAELTGSKPAPQDAAPAGAGR